MKRLWFIAIVLAVVFLGWLVFCLAGPKEPSYQGRTLTEWLFRYWSAQGSVENIKNSETAIRAMGTNAIPSLLNFIQAKDFQPRRVLISTLQRHSLIHSHIIDQFERRYFGLLGFKVLGKTALPALPTLLQLTKSPDPDVQTLALMSLVEIDPEKRTLLPVLSELIHSDGASVHTESGSLAAYTAQELLSRFPEEAEKAGVYKVFPELNPASTNTLATNTPATK